MSKNTFDLPPYEGHSETYLCPVCLASKRINWRRTLHDSKGARTCKSCHVEMFCIGTIARIPKKGDDKGWKEFFKYLMSWRHPINLPKTKTIKKYL